MKPINKPNKAVPMTVTNFDRHILLGRLVIFKETENPLVVLAEDTEQHYYIYIKVLGREV